VADKIGLSREQWETLEIFAELKRFPGWFATAESRMAAARKRRTEVIGELRELGVPWRAIADALEVESNQAAWNLYDRGRGKDHSAV